VLLDHHARHRLAAQEHGLQVDAHDAVEIFLADVEEVGGVGDAGVVDQDIDAAEGGQVAATIASTSAFWLTSAAKKRARSPSSAAASAPPV
jgi:hypothetical protein